LLIPLLLFDRVQTSCDDVFIICRGVGIDHAVSLRVSAGRGHISLENDGRGLSDPMVHIFSFFNDAIKEAAHVPLIDVDPYRKTLFHNLSVVISVNVSSLDRSIF